MMEIRKQKEVYEIGIFELSLIKLDYEEYPIRVEIPKVMNIEQAKQLIECMNFAIETLQKERMTNER